MGKLAVLGRGMGSGGDKWRKIGISQVGTEEGWFCW